MRYLENSKPVVSRLLYCIHANLLSVKVVKTPGVYLAARLGICDRDDHLPVATWTQYYYGYVSIDF